MKSGIYTRTGDAGSTALVGGSRVSKDDARLEAYGTVDELNAVLGQLAARPEVDGSLRHVLSQVQSRMFDIGAYLATPGDDVELRGLDSADIELIERTIDHLDSMVEPLRCFVLPAGCEAATVAHVARTVCRRAERRIVTLSRTVTVDSRVLEYMNRLSDLLFVAARFLNAQTETPETPWLPAKNQ